MTESFQQTYRKIVAPKLRRLCFVQGTLVACGMESFSSAYAAIFQEAIRLGASYLPKHLAEQLEDHISTWLLEEIEKATALFETQLEAARLEVPWAKRCA